MATEFKVGDEVRIVSPKPADWGMKTMFHYETIVESWNKPGLEIKQVVITPKGLETKYILGIRSAVSSVYYLPAWLELVNPVAVADPFHCTCDIMLLMSAGCQCGAFKREQEAKHGT